MDVSKFWDLVEQHRWLPRILVGFWDELEAGLFVRDPGYLGLWLCPSTIRDSIGWIALRPWLSLDRHVKARIEGWTTPSPAIDFHHRREFVLYSHCAGESDFLTDTLVPTQQTVGEAIAALRSSGAILDAVVLQSGLTAQSSRRFKMRTGYSIYLPPPAR